MVKYLNEIKNRIVLLLINIFLAVLICYIYKEILLFSIISSCCNVLEFYFIFTNITEVFSVYLNLILFLSFQIFLGFFVYHLFMFLIPAFYISEYNYLIFLFKNILFFNFFSLFLINSILIPFSWDFFLSFQKFSLGQSFYFESKLNEYFTFYVNVYYSCLIYCQFFSILCLFLNNIMLKKTYIQKFRKLYYYSFIFFATLISPPDIISQLIISGLFILVFEIFLIIFVFISVFLKL